MASDLIFDAKRVGVLKSRLGERIIIKNPIEYRVQTLAERGAIEAVIVDTEDGFSQLGTMRRFLSEDLGLTERNLVQYVMDGFPDALERNISSLADWNRSRTPEVTLVAIPSQRQGGYLKGLILSPYDGSECYKPFANPGYGRPHRDFMYNVTYEAISHAYRNWGARHIGITHFSRGTNAGRYHRDVTTCQVEAMVHFCSAHKGIESFTFLDDHEGNPLFQLVNGFNDMQDVGVHRPIRTKVVNFWGIDFIDLDWSN